MDGGDRLVFVFLACGLPPVSRDVENAMRAGIAALSSVFTGVLLTAQEAIHPKLESDVYTIEQSALTHSDPVAFSIGYPKGRITIYAMGAFLGWRESLQNLVLESLRFPGG